jgi:hypothetical protein
MVALATILSQMRRIYDGRLSKEFGTSENTEERTWEGRITFAVACTGAIDAHYSIFQTLGERFIMVRWPRSGGIDVALAAMNQNNPLAKTDIKMAVHKLLGNLHKIEPVIPEGMQVRIALWVR